MIQRIFLDHPQSIGETYFGHMRVALSFGGMLFLGSVACVVHAFIPKMCVRTGSGIVKRLHGQMTSGARSQQPLNVHDGAPAALTE